MRFFSRPKASKLARAGRRPHEHARGNGSGQRLLAAALAAVLAAEGGLGVGGEVGWRQVAGATGLAVCRRQTPPSENDGLVGATGCWGAGCSLTGGVKITLWPKATEMQKCRNYLSLNLLDFTGF